MKHAVNMLLNFPMACIVGVVAGKLSESWPMWAVCALVVGLAIPNGMIGVMVAERILAQWKGRRP